jgi:2,4-dienoyl-CoA reductase-like NADH-dependent reductase (Old Yellow Enzyme family)
VTPPGLEHVLSPVRIGPAELANRVFMPAHTLLYGEDHHLSERHVAYYRERALGGTGLIITEGGAVLRNQKGAFHEAITACEDEDVGRFAVLADTLHELGTRVFVQLFGIGVHTRGTHVLDEWTPIWGASNVPSIRDREMPLVMEQAHIDALKAGFARSAANLVAAGIDGAELHAAHGYLLGQFLSPAYNKRTDAYGGSVAGRARLALEAAQAVRERVGRGFALGIRLSFDEFIGEAGITPEATEETLELFAASGLFDFFNISAGAYHSSHRFVSPMHIEEGHMVPYARQAKAVVGERAKVMIVGRIIDVFHADRVIAEGAADLVGMTRAHMADPYIVEKAASGRAEETNRCVGANECFNSGGRQISCMMNPVMGRERRWGRGTLQAATPARRIAVVGGGPAGLKVAAVAAERGHTVALYEAGDELGGHLRLIRGMPHRGGWQRAIDNLSRPLERLGVDVSLGAMATAETLRDADVVVAATGSTWDRTGLSPFRPEREELPGAELDNVLDLATAAQRALADPTSLGARVAIVDETGGVLPIGLAELLAEAGSTVEIITPDLMVGGQLAVTWELPWTYPRLYKLGVVLTPQASPERFDGRTLAVKQLWSGEVSEREFDTLVLATTRTPDDALFRVLRRERETVRRVGDALAPRSTAAVIYEGEELGRAL